MNLRIDPELKALLPLLEDDERSRLEANILADGCRVPLVVWNDGGDGGPLLVDGHNRYDICTKHDLPFQVEERSFTSKDAARAWMIREHLGRRNVTTEQASYLRGLRYNEERWNTGEREEKKSHRATFSTDDVSKRLEAEYGVDRSTIKRDGAFHRALCDLVSIGGKPVQDAVLCRQARMTQKEVLRLAQEAREDEQAVKRKLKRILDGRAKSPREAGNQLAAEAILAEPPPLPEGPFRTIAIDPPWTYESRAQDGTHRAANPYPSMSIDEIKALPVGGLAHEDCVLWLWTTNAHMRQAFDVLDAWEFTFKTILTWVKDRMGTGDWLRGQTEHCLMAVRGRPIVTLTNQTTVIRGPLRKHSRKPDEFYALVEALCPGSKVELFSRARRKGWTSHGNQQDFFS